MDIENRLRQDAARFADKQPPPDLRARLQQSLEAVPAAGKNKPSIPWRKWVVPVAAAVAMVAMILFVGDRPGPDNLSPSPQEVADDQSTMEPVVTLGQIDNGAIKRESQGIQGNLDAREGIRVNASWSEDLLSMLVDTNLIVIGEVAAQYDIDELSVVTQVQTNRVVKGASKYLQDKLSIIQPKDYKLASDQLYLLVLQPTQSDYDEDYYSVWGEIQGIFRQSNGEIVVFDESFIAEIESFALENDKDSLSLDELADWFEEKF